MTSELYNNIYAKIDNNLIKIPPEICEKSEYLKFIIDDIINNNEDSHENQEDSIIPLHNIDLKSFKLLLDIFEDNDIIDNIEIYDIVNVINISNFLNINCIFLILVEKIRHIIDNNSTKDLRIMFNEKNDFTEEEEIQNDLRDNWCIKWNTYDQGKFLEKL
tara:strand:- start:1930 stop:2412 length:483 start_codon:yes stop_codon:yes gene_type:complete